MGVMKPIGVDTSEVPIFQFHPASTFMLQDFSS